MVTPPLGCTYTDLIRGHTPAGICLQAEVAHSSHASIQPFPTSGQAEQTEVRLSPETNHLTMKNMVELKKIQQTLEFCLCDSACLPGDGERFTL